MHYSETYWCESLSQELEIWYDNVEHEPENGLFYQFDWEALDSQGTDIKDKMTEAEQREVRQGIKDTLRRREWEYDD